MVYCNYHGYLDNREGYVSQLNICHRNRFSLVQDFTIAYYEY